MFMQFLKSKRILVFYMMLSLTFVALGQQKESYGSLVGTIAFVSKDGRTFVRVSPKTSINLIFDNKEMTIVSDENGDYLPELPVGKYRLSSATGEDGTKLKFQPDQHRSFIICENKTTRFDISLLE